MATVGVHSTANAADPIAGSVRQHASWSPYDNNGGTVVAVAGSDYCIIAGSTRLSTGFSVLSREHSSLHQLSPMCVLASSGFEGDRATLTKRLKVRRDYIKLQKRQKRKCVQMSEVASDCSRGQLCISIVTKGQSAVKRWLKHYQMSYMASVSFRFTRLIFWRVLMPTAQVLFTRMMRLAHTKELAMLHKGLVRFPRTDRIWRVFMASRA